MLHTAFTGQRPTVLRLLKAVQTAAVLLILSGCGIVGAASVGAGVYQAQSADLFELAARAAKVRSCVASKNHD
jgi:hypothetical protein